MTILVLILILALIAANIFQPEIRKKLNVGTSNSGGLSALVK